MIIHVLISSFLYVKNGTYVYSIDNMQEIVACAYAQIRLLINFHHHEMFDSYNHLLF